MSEELTSQIETLKEYNSKIVQLFSFSVSGATSDLYEFDLYFAGTANRAIALINSFCLLLPDEPLGAIALVRIHLDTFLRSNALAFSDDRNNFVREVRSGRSIQRMLIHPDIIASNNLTSSQMTDRNLVRLATALAPRIEDIYNTYCDDIHFSVNAIEKAVTEDTDGINFSIGTNELFTEDDKNQAVQDMIYISEMVLSSLSAYIVHKAGSGDERPVAE